ncbi:putative wall-associated receptor kinase, galacturonan-binding domain-containing protein [Helianthus annuus]|nr:putative wall-associated receptor kinase, galacturonan-binding domain-containing protein [Helianthus annuus]KAJ0882934.1 putative wall-associated receptor kinase, galacturonan-binding domain-containing protein [Helianthus annuus]
MKFLVLMWAVFLRLAFTTSNNETYSLTNSTNLAKPGCESRCGDLIVPYPFGIGIGSNCSISKEFDIYCNTSLNPPKPSLRKTSYTSIKRISDSTLWLSNAVERKCDFLDGSSNSSRFFFDLTLWTYTVSKVNKFTVLGCDGSAWLTSATKHRRMYTGCMVFCSKPEEVVGGECSGNGCCRSPIPQDMNYYITRINSLLNSSEISSRSFAPCTYAFVGDIDELNFKGAVDLNDTNFKDRIEDTVPLVLDWAIGNVSCAEAEATNDFACRYSNSECVSSTREAGGYRCVCKQGYQGNPYLSPGCQGTYDKEHYNICI